MFLLIICQLEPVCIAVEVGCTSSGVGNVASLLSNQDTRRKCRDVLISEVAILGERERSK